MELIITLQFLISQCKKKIIFFSFLTLLLCFSSFSQNGQLQNFNTKEGLPQSQVYDIAQDSIGYLWLATQGGGLARFDGGEFTVFNEKQGLKSNFVNTILIRNDSLFIGTYSGLSIYAKGKFINFESPKVNKIVYINQSIYLATEKGIFIYNNDSLSAIQSISKIDMNPVNDLIKDGQSYLLATKNGLWNFDQLQNHKSAKKIDAADYTSFLKVDNLVYASTYEDGIKVIQNGKIIRESKEVKRINRIHQINNEFWLATDTSGIVVLDDQFRKKQQINQNNGLAINQVRSVIKDKQENIWVGTSGGGLYKLTQNNFQHFDRNSGLKGSRIYAVHYDGESTWISNSEKGLSATDKFGIKPIYNDRNYLDVKVKTIESDQFNNVWIGTEGKGILIFVRDTVYLEPLYIRDLTGKLNKYDSIGKKIIPTYFIKTDTITIKDGLTSNYIKKILIKDRSVWVATYSSGITELTYNRDVSTTKVWDHYGTKKGIRDLKINDIQDDIDGKIWYATKGGNLGYIENSQARGFYQILGKEIAITTFKIRENNIYLGTLGDGIWVVNKKNPKEVKKLSGVKELNSQNVYQLIFDDENNLWVGTEKGVNKVVLDENNSISDVFYFDRSDGFLGIETCQNAIDKDDKGNIWFGTMNGLTKYTPTKSQTKKVKPSIYFENIEVAYQSLDSIDINSFSEEFQLKPLENHLSFQFKSVDINHPKGIEYRWKLNGEYGPWSSKEFIDFANLQNGEYQFTVQARNIDWIESNPIQFSFFIDKPLYQKSWFLWTVYSSLGFIVFIIILLIVRRIKIKNKRKLDQLSMENNLLSLEQKALQLQMNPHFIFNVLNGIKSMGALGETEQMNSTINTFATLLRSILNSSRLEEISLQEEAKTLKNYLILEQQMTPKVFDYEIHLNTGDIDAEEILVPPMLIQPFVENSVKHGFQHQDIKGKIDISFTVSNDFLECKIQDNGIGIEQSKLKKKSHHPSTALKVTKERIESMMKDHQLIIKEENGTIVSFRLPLKTDF